MTAWVLDALTETPRPSAIRSWFIRVRIHVKNSFDLSHVEAVLICLVLISVIVDVTAARCNHSNEGINILESAALTSEEARI